jgi:uncharacterized membrane protein
MTESELTERQNGEAASAGTDNSACPETDNTAVTLKKRRGKKAVKILMPVCFFVLIPAVLTAGVVLFKDRSYNLIAAAVATLSCVPVFIRFERGKKNARELVIIAVMTGISVLGRFIFAPIPGFKPVTAIVIISALYLGGEAGFMIGALSAVVSNFYFGQGPWTPFQMFAWGAIGFLASLPARLKLLDRRAVRIAALTAVGIAGGVLYSVMMDVWTVLAFDGTFNLNLYLAAVAAAAPWMAAYAASNVIFLLCLTRPIGTKLERIKIKHGVFE